MSDKNRSTFLILLALLSALTVPGVAFGQQAAKDFVDSGIAKMAKHDWGGAITDYTKAIELDPKDAVAFNNRGEAKIVKGDGVDGAIADYSKAIELDPKYPNAYYSRGKVKMAKRDWDGAIADFTKVIELVPKYPNAYMNRGNARQARGDQVGADADFAQAEKLRGR